jgi:hypothetical protein
MSYKLSIGHIINPVTGISDSGLDRAQPITFETMKTAKAYAGREARVEQWAAFFPEDEHIVPREFRKTKVLTRSVLDLKTFKVKRKLPLIKDILDRLYENSTAAYFIYSNVDIALLPHFYQSVAQIISQGHDAFVINRRTISDRFARLDEIPLMYAEIGESHKGYDCFLFKRELYPRFKLGSVCIGTAWVGRALLANMVAYATGFKEYKDLHLTFHIGNPRPWQREEFFEYFMHNRKEYLIIIGQIESERGKFPPAILSYLLDSGDKRTAYDVAFNKP